MPVYEYCCQACGAHVEKMQRITEPALTVCPECGGTMKKLVSLSSFHLKGKGWYVTDYKGKNPSNGHDADVEAAPKKAEASAATASTEATTETKTAAEDSTAAKTG